jgi:hypothetical protein
MKHIRWALSVALLVGCTTRGSLPDRSADSEVCNEIEQLYAAENWDELHAYAVRALQRFDFESEYAASNARPLWRMAEACERVGDAKTQAICLRGAAHVGDPDAPAAVLRFVGQHGSELLERCGAFERPEIPLWLAMASDCARGEWAAAQARIEPALPPQNGAPHRVALATHTLLGDLLADAGLCEPALVEYSAAAFGRSLAGDPLDYRAQCDRTLGCVRLETLLLEMGEGAWALEAMKHVNLQRDLLEYFPASQRLDEAARAAANAEAAVIQSIVFKYDLPTEPQSGEFEQDLARLEVFRAPTNAQRPRVWEAPSAGLRLVLGDETLRVESEQPSLGTFEVAWTTRSWSSHQKCFVYTAPTSDVARCVRRFADGSLYFGGVGFDADGLLLRPGAAPYVGRVLLGRPYDDVLRVVGFESNDPVDAPRHAEFGERRRFVALTAVGAYLVGEGYVRGERLVPDGAVRLSYAPDEWYRAEFRFGVGELWRRSGTVVQRSDLSRLASVDGTQVAWTDPEQWALHIEKVKTLVAQAAREQAERDWRRQLEVWGSMDQGGGHGQELGQTVAQSPCYHCDGTGTQYKSGRMESYTYYVYDDPTQPPSLRTGSRWVQGERVTCGECAGSGVQ